LTPATSAEHDALAMQNAIRRTLLAGAVVAMLLGTLAPADAKQARSRLRHELALLKARLAQLESRLQFETRRFESVLPTIIGSAGGLCADPCAVDSDGDGVGDCEDFCPCDPANGDTDGDGMADCYDPCPADAENACIDPCRMDGDNDGVPDCEDPCPWDPTGATDADGDDIPDCFDPCPDSANNDCVDPCPLDSDGDGAKDCTDPCPFGAEGEFPCFGLPPSTAK
jgi:hypothetical protein